MKKKNPVLIFFAITLIWTWSIGFIPLLFGMKDSSSGDFLFKMLVGPAPSIVGLIMVWKTYSKEQRIAYFKRCFNLKQAGFRCLLLLILFYAAVCLVSILISTNVFGGSVPEFGGLKAIINQPWLIFMYLFFALISGPLNEEFGWRGYSLDHLIKKYGFVKASVILGFIWGIWHLPWYYYPSNGQFIAWSVSPVHGLYMIVASITCSLLVSVCYVKRDRSVVAGAFVHLLSNFLVGGTIIYPFDHPYMITSMYVASVMEFVVAIYIINTNEFKEKLKMVETEIHAEFEKY